MIVNSILWLLVIHIAILDIYNVIRYRASNLRRSYNFRNYTTVLNNLRYQTPIAYRQNGEQITGDGLFAII